MRLAHATAAQRCGIKPQVGQCIMIRTGKSYVGHNGRIVIVNRMGHVMYVVGLAPVDYDELEAACEWTPGMRYDDINTSTPLGQRIYELANG